MPPRFSFNTDLTLKCECTISESTSTRFWSCLDRVSLGLGFGHVFFLLEHDLLDVLQFLHQMQQVHSGFNLKHKSQACAIGLLLSFWQLVIKPKPVQPPTTTYMNINCSLKSHVTFFVMWRNGVICCMTQSSHASFVNAFFSRLWWVVLRCTTVLIVAVGSVTRSINWVFMHDKAPGTEFLLLKLGTGRYFKCAQLCPFLTYTPLIVLQRSLIQCCTGMSTFTYQLGTSLDYFHITLVLVLDRILTLSYWPGPGIGLKPDFGLVWGKYKPGVETGIRASPVVLSMWSYTTQLNEEKFKYASLAQCLLWLVKGTATVCTSKKECNKYDLTGAHGFWLAHHNDWSRWFATSSPPPISCPSLSFMCGVAKKSK